MSERGQAAVEWVAAVLVVGLALAAGGAVAAAVHAHLEGLPVVGVVARGAAREPPQRGRADHRRAADRVRRAQPRGVRV
ncbi:MAG TPA: hypothetical protein VNB64_12855, partial [Solirubrobacteraceae bacterium]|nr:hypothetical protein [Solirubrobacteraceae bacterium]